MLPRTQQLAELTRALRRFPVVALLGARQVGKSTLARALAAQEGGPVAHFDLEDPRAIARLEQPMLALAPLRGLVVLDEIQRRPELFPVLRVLADRPRRPARFLVLGSAAPELLRQASESLAGRIQFQELGGLDASEVGLRRLERLWLRGGYPRSFIARTEDESLQWRQALLRTVVERDLPGLGFRLEPGSMLRFWTMLAHYHAQTWNGAELGRAFGVTEKSVHHYLDVLCAAFLARRLQPWHENLAKRQVKAPKVYLADTGLLHALLSIDDRDQLLSHPKVGASWEGFAIGEVVRRLGARPEECYFWALHSGAELDLLVVRGRKRLGFEIKRTDAPTVTPSMRAAMRDLKLDRLDVIHAGKEAYPMGERMRALPLTQVWSDPLLR